MFISQDGTPLNYEEHYNGVYVLTETLKRSANRLNLDALRPCHDDEPEITGGYIVRFDKVDSPTLPGWGNLQTTYPDPDVITNKQRNWMADHMREFQRLTRAANFNDPVEGYRSFVDEQSFINIMLINELTKEQDTYIFSHYMYKDREGPLHFGPLWDYNLIAGAGISTLQTTGWNYRVRNSQGGWESRVFERDVEFRQKWIDDWVEYRRTILKDENLFARMDKQTRSLEIPEGETSGAAVRNFARWDILGNRALNEFTSPVSETWEGQLDFMKNWFDDRMKWIDDQFEDPPRFTVQDDQVKISAGTLFSRGNLLYTTDGSDPRLPGGEVNPEAISYDRNDTITIDSVVTLTVRHLRGGEWSGKVVQRFGIEEEPASAENLVISEIMYRPAVTTTLEQEAGFGRNDFEFLELHNVGSKNISIGQLEFTEGIRFDFSTSSIEVIPAGGYAVIVRNPEAFAVRHGEGATVLGTYSGRLSNDGETIRLASGGVDLIEFTYNDTWYRESDGEGKSLVLANENAVPADWNAIDSWTSSSQDGGTPSAENGAVPLGITYADWAETQFNAEELADPHLTGPEADRDQDGFANLIEYAFLSSPTEKQSIPSFDATIVDVDGSSYVAIRAKMRRVATQAQVTSEYSSDLTTWETGNTPISREASDNGADIITFRDSTETDGNNVRFGRLRLSL